jgi:hypothetical protein
MQGAVAALLIVIGLFALALYWQGTSERSFFVVVIGVLSAAVCTAILLGLVATGEVAAPVSKLKRGGEQQSAPSGVLYISPNLYDAGLRIV